MKVRLTTLLLVLLAGGLVAAGCGSDTEDAGDPGPAQNPPSDTETDTEAKDTTAESSGGGQTIRNDADAGGLLSFDKTTLKAKPGKVTLVMRNPSEIPHAIAIRGKGADSSGKRVDQGGTSKVEADLKPGKYEFYCPVQGHEEGGMKGTLEVK